MPLSGRPVRIPAPGRRLLALASALLLLGPQPLLAEGKEAPPPILRQLDGALSQLAARVSPAVVQVITSGYGPVGGPGRTEAPVIGRQHGLGSGVIVDPAGYVLTNFHVVQHAQRIVVALPSVAAEATPRREPGRRRTYEARVVGLHREGDLALLKIDATGLPSLPLRSDVKVRQGELVFAVGSPEGLASSITMGVVSSAARQVDTEPPMVFIQTDAPINHGNSGGPLVNADGDLVGINTFIFSESGGSQGLGFAIPAPMARFVYESLRKFGHVHRPEVGITAQEITPTLAAGLGLLRDWGVIASDLTLDGPAMAAGMLPGDVVDQIDGRPIDSLADLSSSLYLHPEDQPLHVQVLREGKLVSFDLRQAEARHGPDELADLAQPDQNLVRKLGILGLTVDARLKGLVHLREGTGVIVAARTLDATSVETGLQVGDVIHAVNRHRVDSLEALRAAIDAAKAGEPMVLQIERQGHLAYRSFEME